MKKRYNRKTSTLVLIIVLLLGLVFVLVSAFFKNSIATILLSIGCSLLASAISTFVLTQDGIQNEMMEIISGISESTHTLLEPEHTLCAQKEVGIDIELYKRRNKALAFPSNSNPTSIAQSVEDGLEKHKIEKQVAIGHHRPTTLQYYYDLIGGTCDYKTAEYFALLLSSFWAHNSPYKDVVGNADFDFVVTPKGGSPILGYEFSKLINKPFILHEEVKRFQNNHDDMRTWFNCSTVPSKGSTALIVDDSTTGGTMVLNTIDHLREYGYNVQTCFVVFEPQAKDARDRLARKSVQLISLLTTHNQ